jgi:hypothetical protein
MMVEKKTRKKEFFLFAISLNMSLKSFPIIFINMGGEMVYILEQRLSAQEIVDQKATKGIQIKQNPNERFLIF